jgi:hypothetical protein
LEKLTSHVFIVLVLSLGMYIFWDFSAKSKFSEELLTIHSGLQRRMETRWCGLSLVSLLLDKWIFVLLESI